MLSSSPEVVFESSGELDDALYAKFMKARRCYDCIPVSSKLIVLEVTLTVKKAFFALIVNSIRAAPLWSSKQHAFVGLLTVTDFIKVLQKMYGSSAEEVAALEHHTIQHWLDILGKGSGPDALSNLVWVTPEQQLFDAVQLLHKHRIHRLPVVDTNTGNVLFVLTHKRILRFLFLYIHSLPRPRFVNRSLAELSLGTYHNVAYVTPSCKLIQALRLFTERRVSALPVVDEKRRLIDIYAKFDVFALAAEKAYTDLDVTIAEVIALRKDFSQGASKGVLTCFKTDTLWTIMDRLVTHSVHRLFVVEGITKKLIGVISLSDILHYIVLRPTNRGMLVPLPERTSPEAVDDMDDEDTCKPDNRPDDSEPSETELPFHHVMSREDEGVQEMDIDFPPVPPPQQFGSSPLGPPLPPTFPQQTALSQLSQTSPSTSPPFQPEFHQDQQQHQRHHHQFQGANSTGVVPLSSSSPAAYRSIGITINSASSHVAAANTNASSVGGPSFNHTSIVITTPPQSSSLPTGPAVLTPSSPIVSDSPLLEHAQRVT